MTISTQRAWLSAGAALWAAVAFAPLARATDVLYPGIQPKLSAGAGQTVTRGSTALFYNPANLIFSKFIEPDLDVSYMKVTYTYQHTDTGKYDPAVVDLATPTVTAGLGIRPTPRFAIGGAILPTGTGSVQEIKNVPLELTPGAFQVMNITNKQTSMKIAGGAAFRLADPLTIGVGMIYTTEKTQTIVQQEGEDPFIDALYAGTSNQFIVGVRSELIDRALVLALSYKTAVVKKYKGDILINLDPATSDYQVYEGTGYTPAAIGFGAETRIGMFGVFVDFLREQWSAGRTVYKRGFGNDSEEVDYVDVNNIAAGVKVWVAKKHMLEAAFATINGNVGDGTPTSSGDGLRLADSTPTVNGVGFGDLEAVPRMIFSGGYRYKLTGTGYLEMGASYLNGSRVVPETFPQEGTFTLKAISVSGGIAFGF